MKKQTIKKPKKVEPKKPGKPKPTKVKLTKADPDFYKKVGAISAARRKLDSSYFSDMAKKSHGPKSKRKGYFGGRKPKDATA